MSKTDKESKDTKTAIDKGVDLQLVDIKPCPFCGGKARTNNDVEYLGWIVCCIYCGAIMQPYTNNTKKNAIKHWNTRAL